MKRANGTGSIVKLSGNRRRPWAVKVSGRDKYGHIVQKILSYHAKAGEAQAALDEYNRLRHSGIAPAVDKMNMTLQQVYDGWSAREYAKLLKTGKVATRNNYRAAWNRRVSRYADLKFRNITLDQWQAILDEDEDAGRSQSSVNYDAFLIRRLHSYAMERDIISKDYSQFLDIPSVDVKNPRNALSDLQVAKLSKMAAEGVPWADTALILCYTGFRVSEFLGLTRFNYHPEKGGYLQNGVKTNAGKNRIVPIHPKIHPYLMAWLKKGGDTIICDEDGKAIPYVHYLAAFTDLMEQIGAAGATPHWCRHTFATWLHTKKVDTLTVKWLIGHSTEADITAHYTHETIAVLREAIQLLA